GSQHSGMVEGGIEGLLQLADAGYDLGIEQSIEAAVILALLLKRIESAQELDVLLGKRGDIAVSQNFNQRNLEGREGERAVESIAAPFPLSGDAGVTVKESGHQVGLVAVYVAGVFLAGKIAEQGFGDFRVRLNGEGAPQHGGSDGLIEQAQPAAHFVQGSVHLAVVLQGYGFKAGRDRDFAAHGVLQKLLVEALHGGQ